MTVVILDEFAASSMIFITYPASGFWTTTTWSTNRARHMNRPINVGRSINVSQNDSKSSVLSDQSALWAELMMFSLLPVIIIIMLEETLKHKMRV